MKTILTTQSVLKETYTLIAKQGVNLVPFLSILFVAEMLNGFFANMGNESGLLIFTGVLMYVFLTLNAEAMYLYMLRHGHMTMRALFFAVQPRITKLFFVTLIVTISVFLGSFLLILPGAILLSAWFISTAIVLLEDKGVVASLSESARRTRGSRYEIFFIALIYIIGTLFVVYGMPYVSLVDTGHVVSSALYALLGMYLHTATYVTYTKLVPESAA